LKKVLEIKENINTLFINDYNDFIHEDDRDTIVKTIRKSISQNESYNLQYRLKLKNGKIKFVNEICSLNFHDTKNGITRIIQDITAFKEQEITIDKMVNLHESTLIGTWEYNIDTERFYLSQQLKNLVGIPENQTFLSKDEFMSFIHSDDNYSVNQVFIKSIKVKDSFAASYRFVLGDNTTRYVRNYCSFYTNSSGENIMFGMVKDTTEYRSIQNEYNDKAEIFKSITENSLLGIVIYNAGACVFVNKKWADLVGVDQETLNTNLHLKDVYNPETVEMIGNLFNTCTTYNLSEYSNKVSISPLNAAEFTTEIYIK
jgi:PAS domain-containing protein